MRCRGVRGANIVEANTPDALLAATTELLTTMMEVNDIKLEDVVSVFFTTTDDLNAEFPAVAARKMGWTMVPMLCGHELNVPGSLPMCLRVLLHINTDKSMNEIKHVYLRGAKVLRPDLA